MKVVDISKDKEQLNKQLSKIRGKCRRKDFENRIMCNSCNEFATKLVQYQVGDKEQKATRIEKYCQKHFELIIKK